MNKDMNCCQKESTTTHKTWIKVFEATHTFIPTNQPQERKTTSIQKRVRTNALQMNTN